MSWGKRIGPGSTIGLVSVASSVATRSVGASPIVERGYAGAIMVSAASGSKGLVGRLHPVLRMISISRHLITF